MVVELFVTHDPVFQRLLQSVYEYERVLVHVRVLR